MNARNVKLVTAVETQVSSEDEEMAAAPLAIEHAVTGDLELLIEPVFFMSIVL